MSTTKIDTLEPEFHKKVDLVRLDALKLTGYEWVVVSATRTIKEQHGLYMQKNDGKDNDGDGKIDESDERVTNADGGQSPHNFGMGCDCAPLLANGEIWWGAPKSMWKMYRYCVEKQGLTWGGNFKSLYDAPHMEDPRWKEQQTLWREGKIQVA